VLCTTSSIKKVNAAHRRHSQAKDAPRLEHEELSYPGYTHIRQARQIPQLGEKGKVAVLGTASTPGSRWDALPIALTAVCERVDRVVSTAFRTRASGARSSRRSAPGLTTAQFQKKVDDGSGAPCRADRIDRDDRRMRSDGRSIASPTTSSPSSPR